jgi:hypothetical protein
MQTVSKRFSRTTDLNVIFVCCLVTPAGIGDSGAIQRPRSFAAGMKAMWQPGIDTLAKVFSYNVAGMTELFQDYLYNPHQFDSVKDLYSNYPQISSVARQQLDTRLFADLLKRVEGFPATECACEKRFSGKCDQTQDHTKRLPNATISGKVLSFRKPPIILKKH